MHTQIPNTYRPLEKTPQKNSGHDKMTPEQQARLVTEACITFPRLGPRYRQLMLWWHFIEQHSTSGKEAAGLRDSPTHWAGLLPGPPPQSHCKHKSWFSFTAHSGSLTHCPPQGTCKFRHTFCTPSTTKNTPACHVNLGWDKFLQGWVTEREILGATSLEVNSQSSS